MRKIKAMSSSLQDLKDKWQEVKKQNSLKLRQRLLLVKKRISRRRKKLQPKMVVSGAKAGYIRTAQKN